MFRLHRDIIFAVSTATIIVSKQKEHQSQADGGLEVILTISNDCHSSILSPRQQCYIVIHKAAYHLAKSKKTCRRVCYWSL